MDTRQVVPNFYRTPIPKFHCEMLLFNLAQGLENLECYLKMGKTNFGACARGNVIFEFIKARNEQNLKIFFFP